MADLQKDASPPLDPDHYAEHYMLHMEYGDTGQPISKCIVEHKTSKENEAVFICIPTCCHILPNEWHRRGYRELKEMKIITTNQKGQIYTDWAEFLRRLGGEVDLARYEVKKYKGPAVSPGMNSVTVTGSMTTISEKGVSVTEGEGNGQTIVSKLDVAGLIKKKEKWRPNGRLLHFFEMFTVIYESCSPIEVDIWSRTDGYRASSSFGRDIRALLKDGELVLNVRWEDKKERNIEISDGNKWCSIHNTWLAAWQEKFSQFGEGIYYIHRGPNKK